MIQYKQYFIPILLLILAIACFFMLQPFIITILMAVIATIILAPLHKRIQEHVKNKTRASLATTILVLLLVIVPVIAVTIGLVNEANTVRTLLLQVNVSAIQGTLDSVNEALNIENSIKLEDFIRPITSSTYNGVTSVLKTLPLLSIQFVLFVFLSFYFLRDGKKAMDFIYRIIPFGSQDKVVFSERFHSITRALVWGQLVTALAQGAVATIGYFIFGVPAPLFWGLVTVFVAFIPVLGTGFVWLPASAILFLQGAPAWQWIGLAVYGAFIVSTLDNFLRPYIIGDASRVHPMIITIAAFGGLVAFGVLGVFVGPLVMVLFLSAIELYYGKD